jgi:hypothetical protein
MHGTINLKHSYNSARTSNHVEQRHFFRLQCNLVALNIKELRSFEVSITPYHLQQHPYGNLLSGIANLLAYSAHSGLYGSIVENQADD